MRRICSTSLVSTALFLTMAFTGCKQAPPAAAPAAGVRNSDGSVTNADGSITYPAGTLPPQQAAAPATQLVHNADGSITNPDGSVTYPAGSARAKQETAPVVAARTPQASVAPAARPAPALAPVVRQDLTAPAGARVAVTITQTLSAKNNNVGDSFSGVLADPLTTSDGAAVFPRGTRVEGSVVAAKGRGRFKGAGDLGIQLTSIGGKSVTTSEFEQASKGKGKRTGALIGGGGGLGAIIGGLAGGGKGALIGGLAGAGAGTAGAAYTGNKDVVIASESRVVFRLERAVTR
jgi:hypothetical protein